MTIRTYQSPAGFKQALEERLRNSSRNGVDFARRRQLLVFDRFLARVAATLGKLYRQPFGVDVAFGDPILGERRR